MNYCYDSKFKNRITLIVILTGIAFISCSNRPVRTNGELALLTKRDTIPSFDSPNKEEEIFDHIIYAYGSLGWNSKKKDVEIGRAHV